MTIKLKLEQITRLEFKDIFDEMTVLKFEDNHQFSFKTVELPKALQDSNVLIGCEFEIEFKVIV